MKKLIKKIRDKLLWNNQFDYMRMLFNHIYYKIDPHPFIPYFKTIINDYEFAKQIPRDIDLVVGIPRQGLICANIIALQLGVPLSTPENFMRNETWISEHAEKRKIKKALIIEDSIASGTSITHYKKLLEQKFPKIKWYTGATYSYYSKINLLDYYYRKVKPNMFETSLIHINIGKLGCDIDGVLCIDPPISIPKSQLKAYYQKAKPWIIPNYTIECIVTGRDKKYKKVTEKWLKKHKVKYKYLIMNNNQKHHSIKVDAIRKYNLRWFWESNIAIAQRIKLETGVKVLCIDNMHMY